MSDIRTDGYNRISFWKEDSIGLIVIRSDKNGNCDQDLFKETLQAVSLAYMDDSVTSIAFTGINEYFLHDVLVDETKGTFQEFFDMIHTLIRTLSAIRKPIFSVVNGIATGIGYEFALLADAVIASRSAQLGFPQKYSFVCLGSLTSQRFGLRTVSKAAEGKNSDYVFPPNNFLADAKALINELSGLDYPLFRRVRLSNYEPAMLAEKDAYISSRLTEKANR